MNKNPTKSFNNKPYHNGALTIIFDKIISQIYLNQMFITTTTG